MKKPVIVMMWWLWVAPAALRAQEAETGEQAGGREQVRGTFEHSVLINNQTVETPLAHSLDFIIQHRFGVMEKAEDLFGLFAPSNIRLGLNYGIMKDLSVGIGTTKNKRLYDLEWKYKALKQTKPGGVPVTVTYYGSVTRSALPKANFTNQDSAYEAFNRFSYYHSVIIARKINNKISVQAGASYAHINIVDTLMLHDNIGASVAGRYKISPQSSVQVEFDYPLTQAEVNAVKPNISLGMEVSTGSHQFQIFITTADGINPAEMRVYNQHDFTKREILIGFNIMRQWGF